MDLKKSVAIELDKIRHLRFSTNAIIEFEDLSGKAITDIGDGLNFKDLRTLFYVGLKHEDETLTLLQAGDLMDEGSSLEYITDKLTEAIELALPDEQKKQ